MSIMRSDRMVISIWRFAVPSTTLISGTIPKIRTSSKRALRALCLKLPRVSCRLENGSDSSGIGYEY